MNEREIIEDLCYQFGYETKWCGWPAISSGALSALEIAFDYLGWHDPHIVPDGRCQVQGCREHAGCGHPIENGYASVCGDHMRMIQEGVELKFSPKCYRKTK